MCFISAISFVVFTMTYTEKSKILLFSLAGVLEM